jgi:predicted permease
MSSPRLARLVVKAFVPDPEREFVLGDLDEQFAGRMNSGWLRARWSYWRQVAGIVWHRQAARPDSLLDQQPRRQVDMSRLWQDIRLGVRTARRSPGYSAVTIATLALAIGANTLLFSIANPLLIRGLPVKDAGTLGWIWQENPVSGVTRAGVSMPDFLEWRASTRSFTSLAARELRGATLSGHGDAERVQLVRATADLCELWGLRPAAGRLFQPGEDTPGRPLSAVLSHGYWRRAFREDPAAIGSTIWIDGAPATIVGIMDPEIETYGYAKVDLWVPLPLDAAVARDQRTLRVVGRLAPGATIESANAEIRALAAVQAREHPDTNEHWVPRVVSTRTSMTGPDTWVLLALLGVVVVFVLLIACANLANLVLARVVRRRHDFAVRQALGASRIQLVRPLLIESLLLGIVGGLFGLALAQAGLRVINATAFDTLLQQIGIDGTVLMFTAALSLLTPFLFSLLPALGAGRTSTVEVLRDARSTGGRRASRRRNVLVAAQVALALSLLVVSGLVLRTVMNFQKLDIGLQVSRILTFRIEPPVDRYATEAARARLTRDAIARLSTIPGAEAAAAVSHLPVFDGDVVHTLTGTAHDGTTPDDHPWASWFAATPDFFRAAGIPLVAGRAFSDADASSTQPVAVINRLGAERYFDGVSQALGRTVRLTGTGAVARPVTIVGVVADTRDSQVTRTSPQIYVPFDQWTPSSMVVLIRSGAPADRAADARAAVRAVDAGVAISTPKTMATLVEENTGDNAIVNGMFLGFALLALLLAGGGLYGVVSYSIGQRQREIGVRLALGASPATIRRMVLVEGMKTTGAGVLAGVVLAAVLAQASASLLFGVSPRDPMTFVGVVLLVVAVALLASWSPAARAMRIDPVTTLRAD